MILCKMMKMKDCCDEMFRKDIDGESLCGIKTENRN